MNRRIFLGSGAAAIIRGAVPEYEQPLFALTRAITAPVKIRSIDVLSKGHDIFVRTTSTDGVVGQVLAKEPIDDFLPILFRRVIPYFVGKDARELESLVDGVYIKHYKLAGQAFWLPVASVEQSIWDLLGRTAKKPVAELMGGMRRKEIPVYLSGSGRETKAEEEVDVYVRGFEATGAKAVKFKIGGRMSRNADAYPGRTETMMEAARKRLGDKAVIYTDANGSYDAPTAIQVGRMLQKLNCGFFEEPCPWEEISETKKVADALELPIAAGEQDASLWRFQWMMETGVLQIVQPDLNYNGGFIRAARVARMARKFGIPIVPHNTQTGAAGVKILQFASAIPNAGEYMEYPWRSSRPPEPWYTPNLVVRNGRITVPTGPGLGVDFDPSYLASAQVLTDKT
ncbi:MAG TPA: mandelate racemase/muconate lactonizing enzyme family protein [Bryobacteraceae bacterium]|nr:mandelate racemase/muconate lactonizing enzyme family protein [Bryobacteraceae bacterium]